MIRQHQPGGVRRNTTAAIPKSAAVAKLLNKAILHDVFDIDNDDDSEDLVIIGENVSKNNERKKIETIHQVPKASDDTICQLGVEKFRQITAIESSNCSSLISHNQINVDGHCSNLSRDDGEDLVILGEKACESNKGEKIDDIHQIVVCTRCCHFLL
ncbi:uncharacterized protein LOC131616222 [Vicia villosa]|uniref:uncharacterized protein LOC131616222 n=1 Tax=Vicia villosa TaxID=3911 RepID=UPI00273C5C77|nr:uncharacterized protein LOC131616222 [Vicia villosa]